MKEQVGIQGFVQRLQSQAPRYAKWLPELPRLIHDRLARDDGTDKALLEQLLAEQKKTNRLIELAIVAAVATLAIAVLYVMLVRWHF
jgi:ubiquinone biosynthesis protein